MEKQDAFMPKSPFAQKIYRYFESGIPQFDGNLIKKWMRSTNIEVLGTIHFYLDEMGYFSKISPPFELKDILELQKKYFSSLDLLPWFYNFWNHPDITQSLLNDFNSWIAQIYKEGDTDVKEEIIHVVFLHLFEDKKVKKLFSNWQDDPDLKEAFLLADKMNP